MSSIDNRIVQMKFDNAAFESGARTTMSTLDRLKSMLGFHGASKGLDALKTSANGFNLHGMEGAVTGVSKSFMAMSTIGITTLATITSRALAAGTNIAKALTLDPIMGGLHEYETNMNSIQTILANTSSKGSTLKDVNAALAELNEYSDKTIYNFAEMARNIGTFTAAGVDLETSTAAIKGIANLAAVSGSNSNQASTAMYQLSQALAAGTVKLQDWNSVVNAGMGGEVFQTALKETARVHGVAVDDIIKQTGSFRESLRKGWLTSEILTETLSKFTGDLTKKQIMAMGYTEKQAKEILKMGKIAQDAATKVKTMSQLFDTLKEAAGSGWAQTWQLIFGDFNEAKTLFTGVSNVLGKMISDSADARNKVLAGWKMFGGRDFLIQGIANAFKALMAVLRPIKEAFQEIFPPMTGLRLAALTKNLANFTKSLIISKETAKSVKAIFKGVFSVFSIIGQVIGGVVGVVTKLFGVLSGGSGGILKLAASLGNFFTSLNTSIKQSGVITSIFGKLGDVLSVPVQKIAELVGALANLAAAKAPAIISALNNQIQKLGPLIDRIKSTFSNIGPVVDQLRDKLGSIFSKLLPQSKGAAKGLETVKSSMGQLSAAGDVAKDIWKSASTVADQIGSIASSLWASLKKMLGNARDYFTNVMSSIGIQDIMSLINTGIFLYIGITIKKLVESLRGIVDSIKGSFDNLGGVFEQLTKNLKTMQTEVRAEIIFKIAASLALLAAAVFVLSKIDPKQLALSLAAVGALIGALIGAMIALEKTTSTAGTIKLAGLAIGMLALSVGITALSVAIAILGNMDTKTLVKGVLTIAGILTVVIAASAALSKTGGAAQLIAAGVGITVLAGSLLILAGAIKLFSKLDTDMLLNGGLKIAATLTVLGITMRMLPKNMLSMAAGLLVLSAALIMMSIALRSFASMSPGSIALSLGTLAAALIMMSVAMRSMQNSIAGAAAMVLMAGALGMLAPTLLLLGQMSLTQIALSLLALAGAFTVLGVAGYLIGPLAPGIFVLAAGIALLGVAAMAVGGGLMMFAAGLGTLAVSGAAGAAVLTGVVISIANLLPIILTQLGLAIVAFAKVMLGAAPGLFAAFLNMLQGLGKAVLAAAPGLSATFLKLMDAAIKVVAAAVPKITLAGMKIMTALLNTFAKNIGPLANAGGNAIKAFLNAMNLQIPKVVPAAMRLVTSFISGVASKIGPVVDAAARLVVKFINGLAKNAGEVISAGAKLVIKVIKGIGDKMEAIADAGAKLVVKFFHAVASALRNNSGDVGAAAGDVGRAIVSGMASAIWGGISSVTSAARSIASRALSSAKRALGIHSPSKKFQEVGQAAVDGFVLGLDGSSEKVTSSLETLMEKLNTLANNKSKALAARGKAAKQLFLNNMAIERQQLAALGSQYDELTQKIQDATAALDAAIKQRDDALASYAGQYNKAPDIGEDTTVAGYTQSILDTASQNNGFLAGLQRLVDMGLDNTTYKRLLDAGLGAQPFINKLIDAGPQAVQALNEANAALAASAQQLGLTGSTHLYQAGVDSAQGLLNGLKSQQENVKAEMIGIAKTMVAALKKALKIKSPSREFADVGLFSVQGLSEGLRQNAGLSIASAEMVANKTVNALRDALANTGGGLSDAMTLSPVISPVLDLSNVNRSAGQLNGLFGTAIVADVSYGQASAISATPRETSSVLTETAPVIQEIKFEQTNISPKALSPTEIYRQTRNQLALAQEALS